MNAWTYTDPISEAQGDHLELDMKTKSPQQVIAERGRDVAQIMRDWKQWDRLTADNPMKHSTLSRDPMPEPDETQEPVPSTSDDDEQDE
jgi:hypothetical protein